MKHLTRIFHQLSAARPIWHPAADAGLRYAPSASSTYRRGYACGVFSRKPRIQNHLGRFASKPGEKSGLSVIVMIVSLVVVWLPAVTDAATVTQNEAAAIASNWIRFITVRTGEWNEATDATVMWTEPFTRENRILGYFCPVRPSGYILVSLRRELAPIKAYSTTCNLDPHTDDDFADLLKGSLERILNRIERQVGPVETASSRDLGAILEINYQNAWRELEGDGVDVAMNYQEGAVLLTSNWDQGDPYHNQCPAPPSGDDCTDTHCTVGCTGTAAAQIMRFWCWPPYGQGSGYNDNYDWVNMPDFVWPWSPQAEIDAVAELSYEAGCAASTNYCGGDDCASGAFHSDMRDAYEGNFRYTDACVERSRNDYSAVGWFEAIKLQLNANQPVQYGIPGHSFVCDGWREIGSEPTRQYHMNYGWAGWVPPDDPEWDGINNSNTWYTLDALPEGNPSEEDMIENIHPAPLIGSSISGTYPPESFPYRYVGRDVTGTSATFQSGQNIQFLPDITITCTSTSGGSIRLYGTSASSAMRLFSRGDITKGAKIVGGAIKLMNHGSIKFF